MSDPKILLEDDPNYWPPYECPPLPEPPACGEPPRAASHNEPSPTASERPSLPPASPAPCPTQQQPAAAAEFEGGTHKLRANSRTYGRHAAGRSMPAQRLPNAHQPDMFPAFMSRGALFGAARPNAGGVLEGALQAAGDVSIAFNGPKLSMLDKRVWEALVRAAKSGRLDVSNRFDVSLASIATEAGLAKSSARSAWLSMLRLASARVDAVVVGRTVSGKLLAEASRAGNRCSARFDLAFAIPALSETMQAAMPVSAARWASSPLRQWLLDYFSTHVPAAEPFTLGYLRSLSGYGSEAKRFPEDLRKAMGSLKALAPEIVSDYEIDDSAGNSGQWKLSVERGAARPNVKHPPRAKPAGNGGGGAGLAESAEATKVLPRPAGPAL